MDNCPTCGADMAAGGKFAKAKQFVKDVGTDVVKTLKGPQDIGPTVYPDGNPMGYSGSLTGTPMAKAITRGPKGKLKITGPNPRVGAVRG